MALFDRTHGGYRVFIGDLGARVGKYELEKDMEYYGNIIDVWVARNPPGFAFVVFKHAQDAQRAVRDLVGRTLCGRRVRVEHARPYENRRQSPPDGAHAFNPSQPSPRSCSNRHRSSRSRSSPRSKRQSYSRSRRSSSRSKKRHSNSISRSRSQERKREKSRSRSHERSRVKPQLKISRKNSEKSRSRSRSHSPKHKTNGSNRNGNKTHQKSNSRPPSPSTNEEKIQDSTENIEKVNGID